MTEQQAIEYFRMRLRERSHPPTTAQQKAFTLAIPALEKRIPQIPYCEGDGYADGVLVYDTWICPNCGKKYELDYDEYDYCPNCGQAIDWSQWK